MQDLELLGREMPGSPRTHAYGMVSEAHNSAPYCPRSEGGRQDGVIIGAAFWGFAPGFLNAGQDRTVGNKLGPQVDPRRVWTSLPLHI